METTIWMLSWHLRLSEHLCQPLSASAPGKLFLTPLWAEHWVSSHCSGYLGPTQFAKNMTPPHTHTHETACCPCPQCLSSLRSRWCLSSVASFLHAVASSPGRPERRLLFILRAPSADTDQLERVCLYLSNLNFS